MYGWSCRSENRTTGEGAADSTVPCDKSECRRRPADCQGLPGRDSRFGRIWLPGDGCWRHVTVWGAVMAYSCRRQGTGGWVGSGDDGIGRAFAPVFWLNWWRLPGGKPLRIAADALSDRWLSVAISRSRLARLRHSSRTRLPP